MPKIKNLSNTSDVKEILKELEGITHQGHSAWNVFEDWLSLMFFALQRNEEEYLKIINRYRNQGNQGTREIDHFCKAFGLLMLKMKQTNKELLGEIYQTWEVSSHHAGQFFTPWHIASFMAQIIGTEGETINDPACGAGVMLIAHAKTMTNEQLDKKVFYGQDIDFTCVKMCALNLLFFNLNGYAILGDSLNNERRKIYQTTRSYMGGTLKEVMTI